jgi:hypothetical protein
MPYGLYNDLPYSISLINRLLRELLVEAVVTYSDEIPRYSQDEESHIDLVK